MRRSTDRDTNRVAAGAVGVRPATAIVSTAGTCVVKPRCAAADKRAGPAPRGVPSSGGTPQNGGTVSANMDLIRAVPLGAIVSQCIPKDPGHKQDLAPEVGSDLVPLCSVANAHIPLLN